MSELTLIRRLPDPQAVDESTQTSVPETSRVVRLQADRSTLAKRRWRAAAEDGREFGFDLEEALAHGTVFYVEGDSRYVAEQLPEDVVEIVVVTPEQAAHVAWNLGNLHFGIQVMPEAIRVTEDAAVLQFLTRESLAYQRVVAVFLPLSAGGHHHHHHG